MQNPRYVIIVGLLMSGIGFLLIGPTSLFGLHPWAWKQNFSVYYYYYHVLWNYSMLWLSLFSLIIFGVALSCVVVPAFPEMYKTAKWVSLLWLLHACCQGANWLLSLIDKYIIGYCYSYQMRRKRKPHCVALSLE